MKNKEMRLGDYCIDKESKELCKITPADLITLNYIGEDDESYIPIHLTREVFFKIIFDEAECYRFIEQIEVYMLDRRFIFNMDSKTIATSAKHFNTYSLGNIHYLHQLQNLYYTMTGMELPIDENKLKEYVKTI